jgi:hypothetical protein
MGNEYGIAKLDICGTNADAPVGPLSMMIHVHG